MTGRVIWQRQLSDLYEILLGNKPGGTCIPDEYKEYQMDLLNQIFCSQIGLKMGSIKIPWPTIVDDMVIVPSTMEELQSLLMMCEEYANRERDTTYIVHPEKSVITPFTIASKNQLRFIEECKP